MIPPEITHRTIQTIVAYSADPWESVLPILRYSAPAQMAGLQVIQGNRGDEIDISKVDQADLVIIQRDFPRFTRGCAGIVQKARSQNKSIIYETDDLLIDLPEQHISYPDISLYLTPMLWMVFEADLVTTSTSYLKDYLHPLQPNIRILPNYLHDKLWTLRPIPLPSEAEKVVVGYIGGDTHFHDIHSIAPTLIRLLERFPERMKLRFWGCKPPDELLNFPGVDWTPLAILDYADFVSYFNNQTMDIAIAPLENTALNQAKSHLKFLEYSAIGAAGVYSHLQPYEKIIVQGENGYLASSPEEWETHLASLIENPERRLAIARNAQATVRKEWLLSEHAGFWAQAYAEAFSSDYHDPQKVERTSYIVSKVQDRVLDLEAQRSRLAYQQRIDQQQITTLQQDLTSASSALNEVRLQIQTEQNEKEDLRLQLTNIQHSRSWKFITLLQRIRLFLAPPGSRRG